MKHSLLRSVLLLVLSAVLGVTAAAQTLIDGVYYVFDTSNKQCTVTAIKQRTANTNSYSGVVTVPEKVTVNGTSYTVVAVDSYAFDGSTGVTSITLPNTVTDLGSYSFRNTTGLKSFNIPTSVTTVGSYCFDGAGFESVTIPDELTTLGTGAYINCASLKTFNTGDGLIKFSTYLVKNDSALTTINFGKSINELGSYAIQNCTGLETFTIPATVGKVGSYMAAGSRMKSLVVEDADSTLTMPTYLFFTSETVELPEVYIGRNFSKYSCFKKVTIKSLTIGPKVTAFDSNWPGAATGITEVKSLISNPSQLVPTFSDEVYQTAKLIVPTGTKELYQNAEGWKPFYNIEEADQTGITDVATARQATVAARYAVDGRQLTQPQQGINILKMSDGSTRKVFVK